MQAGTSPLLRALGSDPAAPTPNFLFPQSATDIAQIRELQTQVEDVKKEKQSLQGKVIPAQPVAPLLRSGSSLGWRKLFLAEFLGFTSPASPSSPADPGAALGWAPAGAAPPRLCGCASPPGVVDLILNT